MVPGQIVLSAGISLLGTAREPPNCFRVVLRNSPTLSIHEPEVTLCHSVALLGCEPPPPDSLGNVLWDPLSIRIQGPQVDLLLRVALPSLRTQLVQRL